MDTMEALRYTLQATQQLKQDCKEILVLALSNKNNVTTNLLSVFF